MSRVVLLCMALIPLVTAGCGQKGALYLPPRNGTVVTRPAGANTTAPSTPSSTDQQASAPQPAGAQPPTSAPAATAAPAGKKNSNDSSQPPR